MGPLAGLRIVEFAGIGPAPFCGMMLADHGAEVIRIDRVRSDTLTGYDDPARDFLNRSRKVLKVDLKHPQGIALVRRLCTSAEGLIEGYRPGVMERLGLGPDVLLADNPRMVYGRMTGWGQHGPWAAMAGHDINYIALSGALHACGRAGENPLAPINLVGDFGGGGMLLAFAMLAGILRARESGTGQVIDCAMTDGSAVLMTMLYSLYADGRWSDQRGVNILDSGAHFYETYETADAKYIAVGSVEPQFYHQLLERLEFATEDALQAQADPTKWPQFKVRLQELFRTKTREEWCRLFEGTDACVAPVLSMAEAPHHPHNVARGTFVEVDRAMQPAPAPDFSATPAAKPRPLRAGAAVADELLGRLGYSCNEIEELRATGVLA